METGHGNFANVKRENIEVKSSYVHISITHAGYNLSRVRDISNQAYLLPGRINISHMYQRGVTHNIVVIVGNFI